MKEFTGFVAVDGTLFEDNDTAWQYEDKLFEDSISSMSAARLIRLVGNSSPALRAQVRTVVLQKVEADLAK